MMNIGIFDSGLGGRLVAARLGQLLPEHTYDIIDDRAHAPYGERSYDEIAQLTEAAIQPLLARCQVIVIACNTATAAAITQLRERYPNHHFIGFEPMIKQAAATSQSQHVTLLATQATAQSVRTRELAQRYAADIQIDTPSTRGWAAAIDAGVPESIDLSEVVDSVEHGSDVIIIGCTHYIALEVRLAALHPGVTILEPTTAVARQLLAVIAALPPR